MRIGLLSGDDEWLNLSRCCRALGQATDDTLSIICSGIEGQSTWQTCVVNIINIEIGAPDPETIDKILW